MPFMFADCVLDPDRRELTRAAEAVAVGPQVFDLLLYLIQNRDRVVSKDDILEAIKDKTLKAKKVGKAYRISKDNLEKFMNS